MILSRSNNTEIILQVMKQPTQCEHIRSPLQVTWPLVGKNIF